MCLERPKSKQIGPLGFLFESRILHFSNLFFTWFWYPPVWFWKKSSEKKCLWYILRVTLFRDTKAPVRYIIKTEIIPQNYPTRLTVIIRDTAAVGIGLRSLGLCWVKRDYWYAWMLPELVSLWPLGSIHILLMCSHYAGIYWVCCFGYRINIICGVITSLFSVVARSAECWTYLYWEVDASAGQLACQHSKHQGTLP